MEFDEVKKKGFISRYSRLLKCAVFATILAVGVWFIWRQTTLNTLYLIADRLNDHLLESVKFSLKSFLIPTMMLTHRTGVVLDESNRQINSSTVSEYLSELTKSRGMQALYVSDSTGKSRGISVSRDNWNKAYSMKLPAHHGFWFSSGQSAGWSKPLKTLPFSKHATPGLSYSASYRNKVLVAELRLGLFSDLLAEIEAPDGSVLFAVEAKTGHLWASSKRCAAGECGFVTASKSTNVVVSTVYTAFLERKLAKSKSGSFSTLKYTVKFAVANVEAGKKFNLFVAVPNDWASDPVDDAQTLNIIFACVVVVATIALTVGGMVADGPDAQAVMDRVSKTMTMYPSHSNKEKSVDSSYFRHIRWVAGLSIFLCLIAFANMALWFVVSETAIDAAERMNTRSIQTRIFAQIDQHFNSTELLVEAAHGYSSILEKTDKTQRTLVRSGFLGGCDVFFQKLLTAHMSMLKVGPSSLFTVFHDGDVCGSFIENGQLKAIANRQVAGQECLVVQDSPKAIPACSTIKGAKWYKAAMEADGGSPVWTSGNASTTPGQTPLIVSQSLAKKNHGVIVAGISESIMSKFLKTLILDPEDGDFQDDTCAYVLENDSFTALVSSVSKLERDCGDRCILAEDEKDETLHSLFEFLACDDTPDLEEINEPVEVIREVFEYNTFIGRLGNSDSQWFAAVAVEKSDSVNHDQTFLFLITCGAVIILVITTTSQVTRWYSKAVAVDKQEDSSE
eukprot:102434_1